MIKQTLLAVVVAGFMAAPVTQAANITNIQSMGVDSPDAFGTDFSNTHYGSTNASLDIWGWQGAAPASLTYKVGVDSAVDPTLTLHNTINNDSGFSWSEYIVTVTMNKLFTFSGLTMLNPGDWSILPSGPTNAGPSLYIGTLDLVAGTPLADGDTLDFSYQVNFSGATSYRITEEVQVIPEPTTVSLVLAGGILFGGLKYTRRQRK